MEVIDCAEMMLQLCSVKSEAEIEKVRYVCELASDSFIALPGLISMGQSEREILRDMRIDLLQRGADHTPYIVSASGADGYGDIIMGPSDRIVEAGDVMIIDTGTIYDGYFCDFDRNYAFGAASDKARRAYDTVYQSTDAGFAAADPAPPPPMSGRPCGRCSKPAAPWAMMSDAWDMASARNSPNGRR